MKQVIFKSKSESLAKLFSDLGTRKFSQDDQIYVLVIGMVKPESPSKGSFKVITVTKDKLENTYTGSNDNLNAKIDVVSGFNDIDSSDYLIWECKHKLCTEKDKSKVIDEFKKYFKSDYNEVLEGHMKGHKVIWS